MPLPVIELARRTSVVLFAALAAFLLLAPAPAAARITSIQIDVANSQNATYGGTVFAGSGAVYQKIAGRAFGEVDPADPLNAVITDIQLAPRNADGKVAYSTKFVILKPLDPVTGDFHGNRRIFTMLPNRGSPAGLTTMIGGNAATVNYNSNTLTAANAGAGFLMRRGYTILIPGWDTSADTASAAAYSVEVPVAKNPDGSSIVGPSLEEIVVDNDTTTQSPLFTYAPATLDKAQASLTFRVRVQDPPQTIPADGWNYNAAGNRIVLAGNAAFRRGLYEFVYPAKDPLVVTLGLAALRDLQSFLRYSSEPSNPLAGAIDRIYTHCFSQPCRMMHDFVHLGLNQDEEHRQVVDGILNWAGGGNFLKINYRFAQPGRTHRQHIGRWYPEFEFPFSNNVIRDTVTGRIDGRHRRCQETQTCPKSFMVNSENEYWSKAMSVMHYERTLGDLPDEPSTRSYLMSSVSHTTGSAFPQTFGGAGICTQFGNPVSPYPVLRALLVALDEWVTSAIAPPPSELPRFSDRTLVRPFPQSINGFPLIPARPAISGVDTGLPVRWTGRIHTGDLFDYGPRYLTQGVVDRFPPSIVGTPYPVLAPKNDVDGHNIAGIRLPEIAAPLATYTGWATRREPAGSDEGCDASGQKIPLRSTSAGRIQYGDPRPSIDERYASQQAYVDRLMAAATGLMSRRLLLQEDVDAYVAGAGAAYNAATAIQP